MPEHYNAGDRMPEGVLVLDSATGLPIPASALGGATLAELLASVLPVAPNVTRGGGAVDANTQRVTLATNGPGVAALASIDAKTVPVLDSTNQPFNPDSCAHTYGYSAGLLVTDTATDGATSWVKTYSYTSGNLTGETKWVKQ